MNKSPILLIAYTICRYILRKAKAVFRKCFGKMKLFFIEKSGISAFYQKCKSNLTDTILILKIISTGISQRKTRRLTPKNGAETAANNPYKLELSDWE